MSKRQREATVPKGGTQQAAGFGKKLRREQARREREALRRKTARRRRNTRVASIAAPLVVLAGILGFVLLRHTASSTTGPPYATVGQSIDPSTLAGIQTGQVPWPPEEAHLRGRLSAIGIPALTEEGSVLHTHQHLDLYVDGRRITVPAEIGINEEEGFLSPIHTHDASGIIHVESATRQPYTLGEFFDGWGVRFTRACVGGYCDGGGRKLRVYADGRLVAGNPRQLELTAHQEIVVVFGTDAELRRPIPSTYSFPSGL
jgi:hypothetical protein